MFLWKSFMAKRSGSQTTLLTRGTQSSPTPIELLQKQKKHFSRTRQKTYRLNCQTTSFKRRTIDGGFPTLPPIGEYLLKLKTTIQYWFHSKMRVKRGHRLISHFSPIAATSGRIFSFTDFLRTRNGVTLFQLKRLSLSHRKTSQPRPLVTSATSLSRAGNILHHKALSYFYNFAWYRTTSMTRHYEN